MNSVFRFLPLIVMIMFVGCSGTPADQPDTAEVSGVVKLNGSPLASAIVKFSPEGEGRPSYGETDAEGNYKLKYTESVSGAIPGEHSVTVSIVDNGEGGYGADTESAAANKLPKMASDGSIKKTVEASGNEINIDLTD